MCPHLDAGVHFQEVVIAMLVDHEFDSAGIPVAHMLAQLHSVSVQHCSYLWVQAIRWRYLHHLRSIHNGACTPRIKGSKTALPQWVPSTYSHGYIAIGAVGLACRRLPTGSPQDYQERKPDELPYWVCLLLT